MADNRIRATIREFYELHELYGGANDTTIDAEMAYDDLSEGAYEAGAVCDLIKISDIPMAAADISSVDVSTLQILTNTYIDCDGNRFVSLDQARSFYEVQYYSKYSVSYVKKSDKYEVVGPGSAVMAECQSKGAADDALARVVDDEVDKKVESLETIPDTIGYNIVYQVAPSNTDMDAARGCGLGVCKTPSGLNCLFLREQRSDIQPFIAAYQALVFNAVDYRFTGFFTECGAPDVMSMMLGSRLYNEVLKSLGVDLMRLKLSQYAKSKDME